MNVTTTDMKETNTTIKIKDGEITLKNKDAEIHYSKGGTSISAPSITMLGD